MNGKRLIRLRVKLTGVVWTKGKNVRSVENGIIEIMECGKCGVWNMRSVEN